MQRKGVNFSEEQMMKSAIAAGESWPKILARLTHVDAEYVKEKLYDPMKAEFDKHKKFASGAPVELSEHEAASHGAVANAKALATQKGALDKRAAELEERARALAAKEKELDEKASGIDDLIGKKTKGGKLT